MNYKVIKCTSEKDWLGHRVIGGSSASAIVGENPYKTAQELFQELIGNKKPEDISGKPYVIFGKKAEEHIRALFGLKYTDFKVTDPKTIEKDGCIELFQREDKPFMTATLDGELDHETLGHGGLEIKTTEVLNTISREKWKGSIPMNYYCQILHYMAVREDIQYFVVYALLAYSDSEGNTWQTMRPYFFSREDCKDDIAWLEEEETKYWNEYVLKKVEPPLAIKI